MRMAPFVIAGTGYFSGTSAYILQSAEKRKNWIGIRKILVSK